MQIITNQDYLNDYSKLKLVFKKYTQPRYLLSYSLTTLGFIMLNSYFESVLSNLNLACS